MLVKISEVPLRLGGQVPSRAVDYSELQASFDLSWSSNVAAATSLSPSEPAEPLELFGSLQSLPSMVRFHSSILHAIQAIGWLHMLWMTHKQHFETDPRDASTCMSAIQCHNAVLSRVKTQDSSLTDSSCNLMAVKMLAVSFLNYCMLNE